MAQNEQETIKQDVIDQIGWDDAVNVNDIHVEVINDTVNLSGTVTRYSAKMAAERDAFSVMGVKNVENNIKIKQPMSEDGIPDAELADNVGNMLLWNSNIMSNEISVEVKDRVVNLSGKVGSYWEKQLAWEVARSAMGVADVANELEVELKEPLADEEVKNDVIKAYRRNPIIDENLIKVDVRDGVVKLSGTVGSYQIKHQAHTSAKYTGGVKDVIDEIVIM